MEVCMMCFDRSLKLHGTYGEILFIAPKGEQLKYVLQLVFSVTNNAIKYEAMTHRLYVAIPLEIKWLMVYGDSLVAISQVNKD
jgi:ribonuclease HI